MNEIFEIIEELNEENGSNYKISVLKKYKDNELLKRVLKMTYDRVAFNYGVGKTTLQKLSIDPWINADEEELFSFEYLLDILETEFVTRKVTGNAAIERLQQILSETDDKSAYLIQKIIERDLRINLGKTQINKVFKGLITKPIYMRCDTYNKKTAKNISFPAVIQLKADGTYREFNVENETVSCQSRSGEKYDYPLFNEEMKYFPEGIYTGELTIALNAQNLDRLKNDYPKHADKFQQFFDEGKTVVPRSIGNGIINSGDVPHESLIVEFWDYITHDEYLKAGKKDKKDPCTIEYIDRWHQLMKTICKQETIENIRLIEFVGVKSLKEARQQCSVWMNNDFEGGVLKDWSMVFKDGTSKQQLKLKLEIALEMRCTGTKPGTIGTKREGKVGALLFENDEGTIKGSTSGFSDDQMEEFTAQIDSLPGRLMTLICNDITKSASNDYHALSHPRYVEWRTDKDETDTLEKAFDLKEMAMELA